MQARPLKEIEEIQKLRVLAERRREYKIYKANDRQRTARLSHEKGLLLGL